MIPPVDIEPLSPHVKKDFSHVALEERSDIKTGAQTTMEADVATPASIAPSVVVNYRKYSEFLKDF